MPCTVLMMRQWKYYSYLIEEYPDAVKKESYNGSRPLEFPHIKEIYDKVISRKKRHPELSEEHI